MVDTLQEEQPGTLLEELTVLEVMDSPLEVMDTPLEVMVIHQEDTLQEGQQGTPLEAMDIHLEDMDTHLEVMDTHLAVMDIQLEGMDTRQVAILQDILLEEGIQDLLEVDTTADTTERNKTHLMVRGLLSDINSTRNIGFMLLSSLWK